MHFSYLMYIGGRIGCCLQCLNPVLSTLQVCRQLLDAGLAVDLHPVETLDCALQLSLLMLQLRIDGLELLLEGGCILLHLLLEGVLQADAFAY